MGQNSGALDIECVLGEQIGRCIGRLEAITDIAHVIHPINACCVHRDVLGWIGTLRLSEVVAFQHLAAGCRVGGGLNQPLVGILPEHRGNHGADADAGKQSRVVPPHHLWHFAIDELLHRASMHGTPSHS